MLRDAGRRTDLQLFMLFSENGGRLFTLFRPLTSPLSPQVLQGRVHDLGRRTKDGSSAFYDLFGERRTAKNGSGVWSLGSGKNERNETLSRPLFISFSFAP